MEWIRENWVFIIFFVIFISIHLFGGGCCGPRSHKGHGEEGEEHKRHSDEEGKGGRGCQ